MSKSRKLKIGGALAVLLLLSALLPAGQAEAIDSKQVAVTLPEFSVRLNGMEINNQYAQYPLLVYNNITYFPMTYYGSRYMGVETTWSRENGVGIHQNGVRWNWHDYKRYLPNGKNGVATINTGQIRVNNQLIDNSQEDYPILSFRDVTYFPLTWRFAVDEFGWTYQYSPRDGLSIQSPGAITANEITLPIKEYENGVGAFVKAGAYYYYEGERGVIWQAPVAQPEKAKKVYQMPVRKQPSEDGGRYCRPVLQLKQGIVLLTYQQQEADGQVTHYVQLSSDGVAQEVYQGQGSLHCYSDLQLLYERNAATGKGTLQIKRKDKETFHAISATDVYCASDRFYRAGTEILFLGAAGSAASHTAIESKVMAVDYKTGAVRQISSENATFFTTEDELVYYLDRKHQLYQILLHGGTAKLMGTGTPATQLVVLQGTICYADALTGELRVLGSDSNPNPGGIVSSMEVQEDFFVVNFSDESTSAYKTMILSRKGKVLFKTTERTASMIIENGKVSFVKLRD